MITLKQFREMFGVSPRYSADYRAWITHESDNCEVLCYSVAGAKGHRRCWGLIYKGPRVLFAYVNGNRVEVTKAYDFIKQSRIDKYIPENCEKILAIELV